MTLVIELPPRDEQLAYNRERWQQVLADPELQALSQRIETDRHGNVIMSPPPKKVHGQLQFRIGQRLCELLPEGAVTTESPISTNDGVKAADVSWASTARESENAGDLYETSPEICVEVRSPSNHSSELVEKRALYFAAGAEEVWVCEDDGSMDFFARSNPESPLERSTLCPRFPRNVIA